MQSKILWHPERIVLAHNLLDKYWDKKNEKQIEQKPARHQKPKYYWPVGNLSGIVMHFNLIKECGIVCVSNLRLSLHRQFELGKCGANPCLYCAPFSRVYKWAIHTWPPNTKWARLTCNDKIPSQEIWQNERQFICTH